jgi:hypothetical protein
VSSGSKWALRIQTKNRAKPRAVARRLLVELPFDVIDNCRVLPGKKLADRQEPLAATGGRDHQHIAQFGPLRGLAYPVMAGQMPPAKEQTGPRKDVAEQPSQFMQARKARPVQ